MSHLLYENLVKLLVSYFDCPPSILYLIVTLEIISISSKRLRREHIADITGQIPLNEDINNMAKLGRVEKCGAEAVSYTHLRAHETPQHRQSRHLLE